MQGASLEIDGSVGFSLRGDLTFDTLSQKFVQKVCEAISALKAVDFQVELQKVRYADSAGLALLIQILRYAQKNHKNVYFLHVPLQLMAIAKLSSIDKILPLMKVEKIK